MEVSKSWEASVGGGGEGMLSGGGRVGGQRRGDDKLRGACGERSRSEDVVEGEEMQRTYNRMEAAGNVQ